MRLARVGMKKASVASKPSDRTQTKESQAYVGHFQRLSRGEKSPQHMLKLTPMLCLSEVRSTLRVMSSRARLLSSSVDPIMRNTWKLDGLGHRIISVSSL